MATRSALDGWRVDLTQQPWKDRERQGEQERRTRQEDVTATEMSVDFGVLESSSILLQTASGDIGTSGG